MRYTELSLFGVYVSPLAPMLVLAWALMVPLRRVADRYALLRHVWHPALFLLACYVILLSVLILVYGGIA